MANQELVPPFLTVGLGILAVVLIIFSLIFNRPRRPIVPPAEVAPAPKISLGIGSIIAERYRLDAEIGRGGMGVVYRARDLQNDRDVALKIINAEQAGATGRTQFLREAKIMARLNHPHIVGVYDIGETDSGAPFIAMELVRGTSLDELRGLTFAQIIDLAQQICDALDYAHAQGLVHRDLKPGNVLVEPSGYRFTAKLVDFGLARLRGEADATADSVVGTVYYVAPEVIAGAPAEVGADLYALGVMLYEMVTGRVPFSDFDSQTILAQHLREAVTPPSHSRTDIPPALESVILRLLAKNPQERFHSAREVSHALAQITLTEHTAALNNLPQNNSPFIGRANEAAQICQALQTHRFITLTGANGIGKTRLALHVGALLVEQFSDGVWFVDCAPWRDAAMIPQIVASVLNVREEARRGLMVSLTEKLREKNLLLLVDQCEHLRAPGAQLIVTLLRTCPAVRVLATSREAFEATGEKILETPPLSTTDASKLLRERIATHAPGFSIDDENLLARITQRLNGIPLAIELAAAQKISSLADLDAQLNHIGLDDGTALLPEQILRAVINWVYEALSTQERAVFNRLSVFAGSFTAQSVEAFCGAGVLDVLQILARLVERSLVQVEGARYRLLEPLKTFALGKLQLAGEAEMMRRYHRDGFLLLATQAARHWHDIEQSLWMQRLENEYADILAALAWSIAHDPGGAVQFGGVLWQFWHRRNYWRDGRERLTALLALPRTPGDEAARTQVLIGAGHLAILQADYPAAQEFLNQALTLAREIKDERAEAYALAGLGSIAQARREVEQAAALTRASWEKFMMAGDAWENASALANLAQLNLQQGDPYAARTLFIASLAAWRQVGDKRAIAEILTQLGLIAYRLKEYANARTYLEEALSLRRGLYDVFAMASLLSWLGFVALHQAWYAEARQYFAESLTLFKELNSRRHIADALYGMAGVFAAQRKFERAAKLLGAAEAILRAPGTPPDTSLSDDADKNWIREQIQMDTDALQAAHAAGQALSIEQAMALAIE